MVERYWQANTEEPRETCGSTTLSTTNPTWTDTSLRGERPATIHLSHGTAVGDYIKLVLGNLPVNNMDCI
jgi:hypothetical protein